MDSDVIIIGAGASGLMCALTILRRGKKVTLLDHNEIVGKKLLATGGGRCNFTNLNVGPENYISQNPDFVRSALAGFAPEDFLSMLEEKGIPYYEKEAGQMFCLKSSKLIVNFLTGQCREAGAVFVLNCTINSVQKNGRFVTKTDKGEFSSKSLIVATGGLSCSNLGATGLGYKIAKQFGMGVTKRRPALAALKTIESGINKFAPSPSPLPRGERVRERVNTESTYTGLNNVGDLRGISCMAKVSCGKISFTDKILFTHTGLSGPAILQVSSYWETGQKIAIEFFSPPRRLTKFLAGKKTLEIVPHKIGDYEHAEVTLGGVDTTEISSKTMESKKVRGLYFIGEVLDVTGQLGGYNLHWAWASGHAAGKSFK